MERIVKSVISEMNFNEDFTDTMYSYMDETMIQYMKDNLKDPSRRKTFLKAIERFSALSERATDPIEKIYYEFRCYLPADQARKLAQYYYQREVRSNTWNDSSLTFDLDKKVDNNALPGGIEFLEFSNEGSDIGIFSKLNDKGASSSTESEDLFDKIIYHKNLDDKDRLYLVANLMFGAGPGNRQDLDKSVDLNQMMKNPPKKEMNKIREKVKELIKMGFKPENITKNIVMDGGYLDDKFIPGLIGSKASGKAKINVQNVVLKMFDKDDYDQLRTFFFSESFKEFSESEKDDLLNILKIAQGGVVKAVDLIPIIGKAIMVNLKEKTLITKAKFFKDAKTAFKHFYRQARLKGDYNLSSIQNMIMAPAIEKELIKFKKAK